MSGDVDLTPPEPPSIYECLGRIVAELPAIGKNQRNTEQGFNFRGIDDVLNALSPLLGKHGVFYVPDVLERVTEKRQTRSGGTMYEVNLHVRYTFYGPRGDSVIASGWGEGTDMGDKATNKAMTGAMKYVLFQTFAIATSEQSEIDADRGTPEETVPIAIITAEQQTVLRARIEAVEPEDRRSALIKTWQAEGLVKIERLPVDRWGAADALVALYEQGVTDDAVAPRDPGCPETAPEPLSGPENNLPVAGPSAPYAGFRKDDLVAACAFRGLAETGTKEALLERLVESDRQSQAVCCDVPGCILAAVEQSDPEGMALCPEHRNF